jgi:hypothetical protein
MVLAVARLAASLLSEFRVDHDHSIVSACKGFYERLLTQVNSYDWKTHYHELAIAFECAQAQCS